MFYRDLALSEFFNVRAPSIRKRLEKGIFYRNLKVNGWIYVLDTHSYGPIKLIYEDIYHKCLLMPIYIPVAKKKTFGKAKYCGAAVTEKDMDNQDERV